MSQLRGMLVELSTSAIPGAGTDQHIYIGVQGTGGGREFPLANARIDDFEEGDTIRYWLGEVWDGTLLDGAVPPDMSTGLSANAPKAFSIDLDKVNSVYIRKQGQPGHKSDDAYRFDAVEVTLYGHYPIRRSWSTNNSLWLGNEFGLTAWLPEEREVRIPAPPGLTWIPELVLGRASEPPAARAVQEEAEVEVEVAAGNGAAGS